MLTIFLYLRKTAFTVDEMQVTFFVEFPYNINLQLLQSVSNKFICKFVSCLSCFIKDIKNMYIILPTLVIRELMCGSEIFLIHELTRKPASLNNLVVPIISISWLGYTLAIATYLLISCKLFYLGCTKIKLIQFSCQREVVPYSLHSS